VCVCVCAWAAVSAVLSLAVPVCLKSSCVWVAVADCWNYWASLLSRDIRNVLPHDTVAVLFFCISVRVTLTQCVGTINLSSDFILFSFAFFLPNIVFKFWQELIQQRNGRRKYIGCSGGLTYRQEVYNRWKIACLRPFVINEILNNSMCLRYCGRDLCLETDWCRCRSQTPNPWSWPVYHFVSAFLLWISGSEALTCRKNQLQCNFSDMLMSIVDLYSA